MKDKNPYADTSGFPLPGKEKEFFQWAKEFQDAEISRMTPGEQKKVRESQSELAKRMDS